MTRRRLTFVHVVGAMLALMVMLAALDVGPVKIDVLGALRAPADDPARVILFGARAPRVFLAAVVGASLGLAGAALQALLQNPLACPHVLGISGGAALLGIVAMVLAPAALAGAAASGGASLWVVPGAALLGALGTAALVQGVARAAGRVTPHTLLLTGVIFNAFAAAMITLIGSLADVTRTAGILAWVSGTLTVRGEAWTWIAVATLLVGLGLLSASARDLNTLGLGEEGATALGVDVGRARGVVYLAVALLVAGSVPVSGMVGFVGLIVPHGVRLIGGGDQRWVLPASMWGGAIFLVLADTLARTILGGIEMPVGVVTALCGGPFFLFLLRRQARRELGV